MPPKYWLMKAEPDSRVVKNIDVKFSVDDFEKSSTTAWEGVRNHQAKNYMKSMSIGDQVLFYHSNCKSPGIAGFAEVCKEAYPDHSAWNSEHPYYDPKTNKDEPRWFMVDLKFKSRVPNFVSLALLRRIASLPALDSDDAIPEDVRYIGSKGVAAIKEMALIKSGRLSVQPVDEGAWNTICLLADKGGWEGDGSGKVAKRKRKAKDVGSDDDDDEEPEDDADDEEPKRTKSRKKGNAKAKGKAKSVTKGKNGDDDSPAETEVPPARRSKRNTNAA